MRTLALIVAIGGVAGATDGSKAPPKANDPLKLLAGTWIETSVIYSGEELVSPRGGSNHIAFDGRRFTESTPTGKEFLKGEMKLIFTGKKTWEIDLPHKILVADGVKTVTVQAIVRPVGANGLQIAYFDPALPPLRNRPTAFESTATNGVVLITLKRKP